MPVPRHFSQRPRSRLRPPPHPNQVETDDAPAPGVPAVLAAAGPVVAEIPAEVEPVAAEAKWSMLMKKPELVSIAQGFGLTVPDEATKAQIIALLDAHAAAAGG